LLSCCGLVVKTIHTSNNLLRTMALYYLHSQSEEKEEEEEDEEEEEEDEEEEEAWASFQ